MQLIKEGLEKIIGEERFDNLKETKSYKFAIDSFAMNTFSYLFAAPMELGVAGMDFSEHMYTRLAGVVTNTIFGRPYGIARDWIFKKVGIKEESHWLKKYIGDTFCFAILQMPIYALNLTYGGAEFDEIVKVMVPTTMMVGAIGGPYGIYRDTVMHHADLKPDYEENKDVTPDK